MTEPSDCIAVYPTFAVPDVPKACAWYVDKLGFDLRFLWGGPPTHGAVQFGAACVHFWQGPPQLSENWLYFDVVDVDALFERAERKGVDIADAPSDRPWGMREFNAVDLNGYKIRFGQNLAT